MNATILRTRLNAIVVDDSLTIAECRQSWTSKKGSEAETSKTAFIRYLWHEVMKPYFRVTKVTDAPFVNIPIVRKTLVMINLT